MVIKNIWIESREYSSLDGLKLLPGETADISCFAPQQIANCQELQNDFTRGYCVCIGKGIIQKVGKEDFLKAARNRSLEIERTDIRIPAQPKLIPPKLTSFDKRSTYTNFDKTKDKGFVKKTEAIEQDPDSKDENFVTISNGQISVTRVPKQTYIDLEPFAEHIQTKEHYQLPKPRKDDTEVQEILERIKDKDFDITPMCGGVNRMGRACNKRAVRGHKHCVKHMGKEESIDYQSQKRGTTFVNGQTGDDNGIR